MVIKRIVDFIFSAIAILLFSPLMFLIAVLIKVKLGGPIIFKQQRPGLYGKPFYMYKFRSMKDATDKDGNLLPDEDRVTGFGLKLRATSLDELPGLFSVFTGRMSLVGPRPLLMQYLPLYNVHQARRHNVRPGITGWAQINGRNAISWEQKFDYDVWYVDNQSLYLDFKIIVLTVLKVLMSDGVSATDHVTVEKFNGNPPKSPND